MKFYVNYFRPKDKANWRSWIFSILLKKPSSTSNPFDNSRSMGVIILGLGMAVIY